VNRTRARILRIAIDASIFGLASLGTYVAQTFDRPITAALIYLVGVIFVGARSGLAHGVATAIAASAAYNFFLSEPVFRFGATSADELFPLIAFNLSAVLTGALAGKLKDSARKARAAESEIAFLLRLSDKLQKAISAADAVRAARAILPFGQLIDLEVFILKDGKFTPSEAMGELPETPHALLLETRQNYASRRFQSFPLMGSEGEIGLVNFELGEQSGDMPAPDLQGAANILALAIDRCLLLEQLATSQALQKSEELKTAILSSVSHDLRTPLTAIEAAATSLRSFDDTLSRGQKAKMLATISEQCRKLNRYTANLLDMGRIQSGIPAYMFMDVDVIEILGVVLGSIRQSYPAQEFVKNVQFDTAVINANPAMLEQVIFNIVENAVIHGASLHPIAIGLEADETDCYLTVTDHGPGIPREEQPLVFTKFFRSRSVPNHTGNGLGLHIAQGFAEAFGGSITIISPHKDGQGTRISVRLPLVSRHMPRIGAWQ
jgi:two-component system sensor histidine kinase KdpD